MRIFKACLFLCLWSLLCLLNTFVLGQNVVPPWHAPAASWRVIISLDASNDVYSPRAISTVVNSLPACFQPLAVRAFLASGLEKAAHFSMLGNEGYQVVCVLPPAVPGKVDSLFVYFSDVPGPDSNALAVDTAWLIAGVFDTNSNGLADNLVLANNEFRFSRAVQEATQKLYLGYSQGKIIMKRSTENYNYCQGMNTGGTTMVIRKKNTMLDYGISLNRSIVQKSIRKSGGAAEILLQLADLPGIPFHVSVRYLIYRGLPFVQQSIIAVPDSANVDYFIPSNSPAYWAERSFYSLASRYQSMYADAYGWDTIAQKWNADMRYFLLADSGQQHACGSMLHNKGVIRISWPYSTYINMFDSYGYHADGLCLRNVYGCGPADSLRRLFSAASLGQHLSVIENRDCNIVYPLAAEIIPSDDTLVVQLRTPAADSLHIPLISLSLSSPAGITYPLVAVATQAYRSWHSLPFVFPQPADTGMWLLSVSADGVVFQRSFQLRNFIHPCVFFTQADIAKYQAARFSGFNQTLWNGLVGHVNTIRSKYNSGNAPILSGASGHDIRGYEEYMQALAFRLAIEWNATDWAVMRAYVFTIMSYPEWGYEEGKNSLPFNNLDLTHSQFLMGLSCAYDWLYPHWSQAERRQIREFIRKEANDWVDPAYGSYYMREYPVIDWSTRSDVTNNHYWINNAAIEIAARLLQREIPEQETDKMLSITTNNLRQIALALPGDGGSHEGPGYHAYGFQNMAKWMAARRKASGSTPLDTTLWLKRAPAYELASMIQGSKIPSGRYLLANFADCPLLGWAMPRYYMALTAHITGDTLAQWITRNYYENYTDPWTYIFYDDSVAAMNASDLPRFAAFDSLGLVYNRSSWLGDNNYLAFKCGDLMGGHAQPDLNSFILARKGIPLVIDPGYSYKKLTNEHNTVMVSGQGQVNEGTQWYDAPTDAQDGILEHVRQAEGFVSMKGNASYSYINPGLQQFHRNLLMMDTNFVLVLDDLRGSDTLDYDWLLHTVQWKLFPASWEFIQAQENKNTLSAINGGWRSSTLGQQLGIFPLFSGYTADVDTFKFVPEGKPDGGYNSDFQFYNYGFRLRQSLHTKNAIFRNLLVVSDSCALSILQQNDSVLSMTGSGFKGLIRLRFQPGDGSLNAYAAKKISFLHAYDTIHWSLWFGGGKGWQDSCYRIRTGQADLTLRRDGPTVSGKYWSSVADTLRFAIPGIRPVLFVDAGLQALTKDGSQYVVALPAGEHQIQISDSALIYPQYAITGFVNYANASSSPLPAVWVLLCDTSSQVIDSVMSDASGSYSFASVFPGKYVLTARSNAAVGGINTADALAILKHFVHFQLLQSLFLKAADVDLSHTVNALDALLVHKFFVEIVPDFHAGPWTFESKSIQLDADMNVNLKGVCTGDVNGSYLP